MNNTGEHPISHCPANWEVKYSRSEPPAISGGVLGAMSWASHLGKAASQWQWGTPPGVFSSAALPHFTATSPRTTPKEPVAPHKECGVFSPFQIQLPFAPRTSPVPKSPEEKILCVALNGLPSLLPKPFTKQAHRLMTLGLLPQTLVTSMGDYHVLEHMCTFPHVHESICMFVLNAGISKHLPSKVGCTHKGRFTRVQTLTQTDIGAVCLEEAGNRDA